MDGRNMSCFDTGWSISGSCEISAQRILRGKNRNAPLERENTTLTNVRLIGSAGCRSRSYSLQQALLDDGERRADYPPRIASHGNSEFTGLP